MQLIIAVLLLITAAVIIIVLIKLLTGQSKRDGHFQMLAGQLEAMRTAQDGLSQKIAENLSKSQQTANENLKFNSQTLEKVNNQLGRLQSSSQRIMELGSDLKNLQQILASPKLRGELGEWQLENILAALLPTDSYALQYTFKDGKKVDALVKMPQYSVPIDAKFPLENFKKLQAEQNPNEAVKLRREFLKDVRKHIDKITASYIKPDEGTLDLALMFIPAENVYYEAIVKQAGDTVDINSYAIEKRIFPVSPNLLYVYLMTIVMGLNGMQIEKQAAEIRKNLSKLNSSFAGFISLWDTLGGHLRNAGGKYDDGQKKLDNLTMQLNQIQQNEDV